MSTKGTPANRISDKWKFPFRRNQRNIKQNEPTIHESEQCVELLKGAQKNAYCMYNEKNSYVNFGEEDQMEIVGYSYDVVKSSIALVWMVASLGVLRLFFHWYPHLHLKCTYRKVPVSSAEKLLIIETYKDNHVSYHVKSIQNLTPQQVLSMENAQNAENETESDVPLNLSVHFNSGKFVNVEKLVLFTCKKVTYIWNKDENKFVKLRGLDVGVSSSTFHESNGLTKHEQFTRRIVYGPNHINIPEKGVITLLFLEVLNPFYIFQIASFALWFSDQYYAYATAILIMSVFGIVMSIVQTTKNQRNLKSTVHSSAIATVLRPNYDENGMQLTETLSTEHLVPGDVLEIPQHGCIMQCDAVLLSGNCILNEAMLTGESVPVTKTPLANLPSLIYDEKEHARHTLFCGTKVIQTRSIGDEKVLAIVIRTGFSTSKGGLVRSILYPPPVDYRFEKDSYRFIILLAMIASIGFVYTIITKTIRGVSASHLLVEALDLITIVVPPALPAAMTVGRMYAQRRLKHKNIFCISPRTINVSGSIDCVCFDKTGTLTEDGLDMLCIVPIVQRFFQVPIKDIFSMAYDTFMFGMVTCHSITIIDGEMRGDPLDLKMFESTGWCLDEPDQSDTTKFESIFPTTVRPPQARRQLITENAFDRVLNTEDPIQADIEIGILREFPFSSSLQRMSVIVRKLGAPNFEFFCKGSPEMILTLVNKQSVPDDFHQVLEHYTQRGYRVIAIAHKEITKMSYAKIQRVPREKIEFDLNLIGLIILENRLKPETTPVIQMLNEANIRTIMVTGDNLLTALSVARECQIVSNKQPIITVNGFGPDEISPKPDLFYLLLNSPNSFNFNEHPPMESITAATTPNGAVGQDYSILSSEGDNTSVASVATMDSCTIHTDVTTDSVHIDMGGIEMPKVDDFQTNAYRFAMTGKTWSIVRRYFPELIPRLITRGVVFARMNPDQKQSLIQELQALGYYVAMVGDGANDVGALRSSHCGISLSDTESSVASPFTSKTPNITAITNVISQGRAALVTSFSIFKYMAAYSLTQFISVMLLYSIETNLSDLEFLYIDLFVITVFAYFFGKTEANTKKLVPERPLNSLIGLTPVLSLIMQMVLVGGFQLLAFMHLKSQDWYEEFDPKNKHISVGCVENFTIFTISSFQYIILAVVFSKGKPHRKPIFTNIGFILSAILLTVFSLYLSLIPNDFFVRHFELVLPPKSENTSDNTILNITRFQYILLAYAFCNAIMALILENIFIDWFVFRKLRPKFHNITTSKKKFLRVEAELKIDLDWPKLSDNFNVMSRQNARREQDFSNACNFLVEQTNSFSAENKVLDCFVDQLTPKNDPNPLNVTVLAEQTQTPNRYFKRNTDLGSVDTCKSMFELDTFRKDS